KHALRIETGDLLFGGVEAVDESEVGEVLDRLDHALVVEVVLLAPWLVHEAPAGAGGEERPPRLTVGIAHSHRQAVLRDAGLVEVGAEAVVAVLVDRELGDDLLEAAAIVRIPGPLVEHARIETGGRERVLVVDARYRVPVLGQAIASAVSDRQSDE